MRGIQAEASVTGSRIAQIVVFLVALSLVGLVAPSSLAAAPGSVPGRFCKVADIGKRMQTARYGTIECKREGNRARWKRVR
jgi:hypothetical protein